MTYPAVPGHRMAYDRDSSLLFYIDLSGNLHAAGTSYSSGAYSLSTNANAEQGSGGFNQAGTGTTRLGLVFPELRDIVGYFLNITASATVSAVETSTTTTTGLDGTWTSSGTGVNDSSSANDEYRTAIQTVSLTGVKGFRLAVHNSGPSDWTIYRFHVYGQPSTGQNPDSLRFWDPVANAEISGSFLDFGDIAEGALATKTFQIKNISSTKTANSISLTIETLTNASPSLLTQYQLSSDGTAFSSTISIGNLAPGALSSTLYLRDNVSLTAALAAWDIRVVATPTSWS